MPGTRPCDSDFLLTPCGAVFSPLQRLGIASPSENVLNMITEQAVLLQPLGHASRSGLWNPKFRKPLVYMSFGS